MTDKSFLDNSTPMEIHLNSVDEAILTIDDSLPPPYEHPQIDFNSRCKDRGFAIVFWIQMVIVIVVGLVLGIPPLIPLFKHDIFNIDVQTLFGFSVYVLSYSVVAAAVTSVIVSFGMFFVLQKYPSLIIICSVVVIIIIEILLCLIFLYMLHWAASIGPFIILLITLIFVFCIRKRIIFTGSHLRVGCAVLRSHPSLIFVAFIMFVVQILWLIFCCLMIIGIIHICDRSILNPDINTMRSTSINNQYATTTTTNSSTDASDLHLRFIAIMSIFLLLLTSYWGEITFGNISHFITACTVGRWWFPADTSKQYAMRTSVKRAFTTNFGTICFGSLVQATVKTLRWFAKSKKHDNILARCVSCLLGILEKLIGYMNEWGFIYAALTGQSFIKASKSFIQLFKKRGWTMVINDTIVEYCLTIVNILTGLVSAIIGSLVIYFLNLDPSTPRISIIIVTSIINFLIGIFFSSFMTMVLSSCVRTVFVCFALNPAALGATHPDHLQSLTKVWHKFYPKEYSTSTYDHYLPKSTSKDDV